MSIEMERGRVVLRRSDVAVLKRARGTQLRVTCGTLWLTIDGEQRDVVLEAGERFVIGSDADVVLSAIAGAAGVSVAAAVAPTLLARLSIALRTTMSRIRAALASTSPLAGRVPASVM